MLPFTTSYDGFHFFFHTISDILLPECKLVDAAKGGSDGCGAKLIKVVLVARLVDGIPELAVKLTLDIGTIVGTLVINSGPSNSGPCLENV